MGWKKADVACAQTIPNCQTKGCSAIDPTRCNTCREGYVASVDGAACVAFEHLFSGAGGYRCRGKPKGGEGAWNNFGKGSLTDCQKQCADDSGCKYVIFNEETGACTEFAECEKSKWTGKHSTWKRVSTTDPAPRLLHGNDALLGMPNAHVFANPVIV